MRRRALNILLLLLGGAIVNVAVAWVAANAIGEKRHITRTYSDGTVEQTAFPESRQQGWPLLALVSEVPLPGGGAWITTVELSNSVELAVRPMWPGFAINTIFYAAVLWMVFAFPFVLRRRRRIKRGLCPACAYPVGTSPVCTECGTQLPLPLGEGRGEGRHNRHLRSTTPSPLTPLPEGEGDEHP